MVTEEMVERVEMVGTGTQGKMEERGVKEELEEMGVTSDKVAKEEMVGMEERVGMGNLVKINRLFDIPQS